MPPSYDAGGFRSSLYYARLSRLSVHDSARSQQLADQWRRESERQQASGEVAAAERAAPYTVEPLAQHSRVCHGLAFLREAFAFERMLPGGRSRRPGVTEGHDTSPANGR